MLLSADGDASLGISSSLRKLEDTAMEMRAVNEQQPIILLGTPAAGALVEAEISVARGWLWGSLLFSFVLLVALTANINGADSVSDVISTQISPFQAQQTYGRESATSPLQGGDAPSGQPQDARRALAGADIDTGTSSGPEVQVPKADGGNDSSRNMQPKAALPGRPKPMLTYRRFPAPPSTRPSGMENDSLVPHEEPGEDGVTGDPTGARGLWALAVWAQRAAAGAARRADRLVHRSAMRAAERLGAGAAVYRQLHRSAVHAMAAAPASWEIREEGGTREGAGGGDVGDVGRVGAVGTASSDGRGDTAADSGHRRRRLDPRLSEAMVPAPIPIARFLWPEEPSAGESGGRLHRMQARATVCAVATGVLLGLVAVGLALEMTVLLHVGEALLMGWSVLLLGLAPTQSLAWRAVLDVFVSLLARRCRVMLEPAVHSGISDRVAPM